MAVIPSSSAEATTRSRFDSEQRCLVAMQVRVRAREFELGLITRGFVILAPHPPFYVASAIFSNDF